MELEKETNVGHRRQNWCWGKEQKWGEATGRGEGESLLRFSCSRSNKSMQQRLTWNLEPRWDDCKVGGPGGARARKGGVRKLACEA